MTRSTKLDESPEEMLAGLKRRRTIMLVVVLASLTAALVGLVGMTALMYAPDTKAVSGLQAE